MVKTVHIEQWKHCSYRTVGTCSIHEQLGFRRAFDFHCMKKRKRRRRRSERMKRRKKRRKEEEDEK